MQHLKINQQNTKDKILKKTFSYSISMADQKKSAVPQRQVGGRQLLAFQLIALFEVKVKERMLQVE